MRGEEQRRNVSKNRKQTGEDQIQERGGAKRRGEGYIMRENQERKGGDESSQSK